MVGLSWWALVPAMMAFSSVIEPLRAANVPAKRQCYRSVIIGDGKQAAGLL
jgi:hypothetical protein